MKENKTNEPQLEDFLVEGEAESVGYFRWLEALRLYYRETEKTINASKNAEDKIKGYFNLYFGEQSIRPFEAWYSDLQTQYGQEFNIQGLDFPNEEAFNKAVNNKILNFVTKEIGPRYLRAAEKKWEKDYSKEERTQAQKSVVTPRNLKSEIEEANKKTKATGSITFRGTRQVGVPKRPGETRTLRTTENLTFQQWNDKFVLLTKPDSENYSPDFKRQFREFVSKVTGTNPQLITEELLVSTWITLGEYAIEKSQESGVAVDPYNVKNLEDYKSWLKTQEAKDSDRQSKKETFISQLKRFYFNNGLEFTNKNLEEKAEKMVNEELSYEGYVNSQRGILSELYPTWAKSIESGIDIRDLADSYISKMASVLELDEDTIDLNNNLIQKAIQNRTADGKPTVQPLRDFEVTLRNDPRWEKTSNARQEITSVSQFILEKFGKR